MPNIITHKIFAEEVLKQMDKQDIRSMIERHPQIFYIGSNGPDFLFFSHSKPWEAYKNHALNHLGSAMHSYGINAFYETAVHCVRAQKKDDIRERMSVYLFGHLCHWALDKTSHPYIFYRTGNCKGASAGLHHRFESMLDTIMLKKYHDMSIRDYPCYEICAYDEDILKAIARIYVPAARYVYHQEVKVHDIREALNSWYDIQKLLYDPNNVKYPLLKGMEALMRKPWAISGNIVRVHEDSSYDILNEEHAVWKHPCDDTIISNASFIDLFEDAIKTAIRVVDKAYGSIEYGADAAAVFDILQDAAYDTGMAYGKEMKHFDIIYE